MLPDCFSCGRLHGNDAVWSANEQIVRTVKNCRVAHRAKGICGRIGDGPFDLALAGNRVELRPAVGIDRSIGPKDWPACELRRVRTDPLHCPVWIQRVQVRVTATEVDGTITANGRLTDLLSQSSELPSRQAVRTNRVKPVTFGANIDRIIPSKDCA